MRRRFVSTLRRELFELALLPIRYWPATLVLVPLLTWTGLHLRYNVSPSVPFTFAWIEYGRVPKLGEYMIYRYHGLLRHLPSHTFFKRVAGLAGATITVKGRTVWVDDHLIGYASPRTHRGISLTVIPSGPVPAGYVFAQGDNPASFDSRYRESGLVALPDIVGVAHPIF